MSTPTVIGTGRTAATERSKGQSRAAAARPDGPLADVIPIERARSRRAAAALVLDVDDLAAARLDLLAALDRLDGARARVQSRLDAVNQQMRDHGIEPEGLPGDLDTGDQTGQPPAG